MLDQSWIHFRFVSTGRKRPPAGKPCYYSQPLWVQIRFQWIQTTGLFHVYLPNQTEIGSKHIYELTFRKFQKLGRLTSSAVVFLIETSFPFYEWYKLRLFSFNTITVIYIYKGGGWRGLGDALFSFEEQKKLYVWVVVVFHCSAIINTITIKCFYCEKTFLVQKD